MSAAAFRPADRRGHSKQLEISHLIGFRQYEAAPIGIGTKPKFAIWQTRATPLHARSEYPMGLHFADR
jgi:hypothetical protein